MKKDINYVRSLLEKKKLEENVDKEKLKQAEFLLSKDDVFFKLNLDSSVGLLYYLGVPKEEIKELYQNLISIEEYQKINKDNYISLT